MRIHFEELISHLCELNAEFTRRHNTAPNSAFLSAEDTGLVLTTLQGPFAKPDYLFMHEMRIAGLTCYKSSVRDTVVALI